MDLTVSFPGGKKVNAQMGDFLIETDQSVASGGEGSSPEPFMYCLASLGTCAGIYVLSYLQARGLPSDGVRIVQRHEANPETGRLGRIQMFIHLPDSIPEKHHKPIKRSAEKCAVKRLIEEQPTFSIEIEGGSEA